MGTAEGKDVAGRVAARLLREYWRARPLLTLRRFMTPIDGIAIDRPFFLLGTQTGGLSLISRMLRRNSRTVYCHGNSRFWSAQDEMQNVRFRCLPEAFRLGIIEHVGTRVPRGGIADHPEFGLHRNFIYACDELLGLYRKTEADYTPEVAQGLADTIRACIRAYAHDIHDCRFLDKSQTFTLKMPLLRKCLPGVRFILVARNPYAQCIRFCHGHVSKRIRGHFRTPPTRERLLDLVVQHWRNTFRIALADMEGHDDCLVLRFEDFLGDVDQGLRGMADFLELPFEPGMVPQPGIMPHFGSIGTQKWYPVHKEVNRKHLRLLDEQSIDRIREGLQGLDEHFDYTPDGP